MLALTVTSTYHSTMKILEKLYSMERMALKTCNCSKIIFCLVLTETLQLSIDKALSRPGY